MNQDKLNTALLLMDMQNFILHNLPDTTRLISNVTKAINYARQNEVLVIYVKIGFRPGMPEISSNNKAFSVRKENWKAGISEEWMSIEPAITPLPDEIIVTKRRVSAFTGSDLEVILRAKGIQHIVLSGVATSGVVLSTLREAADKDYRITVLSDCCSDGDDEVHRVLTTKVFPRQADVLTVEEWSKI